jgi:uncharacterized iron-regulated membrane protein
MSAALAARQVLVKVHRYVGLSLALFLIVVGATGSIIAFYKELDTAVNPRLRRVEPQAIPWTTESLLAIRERLEAQDPRSHVFSLQFPQTPDESVFSRVMGAIDPVTGEPFQLDYSEVFADPYTGERLGQRLMGHFSLQRQDLISQIHFLHYALVLPEMTGAWFMGMVALVWMFDCFAGFYLTLPAGGGGKRVAEAPRKSFFSRWKTAWQIKRGAGSNRLIYDTHRAASLWLWLLLIMYALTGFALDTPAYYARIMNAITGYQHLQELQDRPPLDKPLIHPQVDWYRALELGQRYLAEQAQSDGFEVGRPAALEYRRDLGTYFYLAHTSRDLRDGRTPTHTDTTASAATVAIDATDGHLLAVQIPTGQRAGNTFTSWVIALHVTSVFGRPWQIAVSALGIMLVVVSTTGVLIWWRKRKSRSSRARDVRVAAPVASKALAPERPA